MDPTALKLFMASSGVPVSDTGLVTDSLILHLDAGDSSSYPGTGTTWSDISGNSNDGTLDGPTYNSGDGGYFDFDGSNDKVNIGTQINSDIALTDASVSFWAYIDSTAADEAFVAIGSFTTNRPLMVWYDISAGGTKDNTGTNDVGGGSTNVVNVMVTDSSGENRFTTSNNALNAATWYNISVVLDVTNNTFYTYINGVEEAKWVDSNTSGGINSSTLDFMLSPTGKLLDGRMSQLAVYTKALTASEVTQNFDAIKSRYGY